METCSEKNPKTTDCLPLSLSQEKISDDAAEVDQRVGRRKTAKSRKGKGPSEDDCLSESSVLITPDSTPEKDKTISNKETSESVVSQTVVDIVDQSTGDFVNKSEDRLGSKLSDLGSKQEENLVSKSKGDLANTSVESSTSLDPSQTALQMKSTKETENKTSIIQTAAKKTLTNSFKKEAEKDQEHPRPKSARTGGKGRSRKKRTDQSKTESGGSASTSSTSSKPRASQKKKTEETGLKDTHITDFFAVRRSDRRCKTDIQKEQEAELQKKILSGCEDGLKIEDIANKGRGVVATKKFLRGDFVVEYAGDLITIPEAIERESKYAKDPTKGCYMYYFNHKNQRHCIDATEESGKLGRLLNHSKTQGNCQTRLVDIKGQPYLILIASRDIDSGEELLYDYGDRSRDSLASHPWLKS